MKKLSALLLVLAVFAVACGDDDPAVDAGATGDGELPGPDADAGEDLLEEGSDALTDEPEEELRIVSLSSTATEILFAIGAGEDVVAVDQFSNYPAEAPMTDLDGFSPNVEAIAAFEPDLVTMQTNAAAPDLEALGITVVQRDAPATFEGIYEQIEELGAATGRRTEAAALVQDIRDSIAEFQAAAPDATGLTYYHELGTDLFSLNSETFIAQVYGLFGLQSIGDAADGEAFGGYLQLTEEYILATDPDLIFLADTKFAEQTAATVADRPGWADLKAVTNDAVIELDDDVASRWGPRVVEFAEAIANALERVAEPT